MIFFGEDSASLKIEEFLIEKYDPIDSLSAGSTSSFELMKYHVSRNFKAKGA